MCKHTCPLVDQYVATGCRHTYHPQPWQTLAEASQQPETAFSPVAVSPDNKLVAELEVLLFTEGLSKLRRLGGSLWQHSLRQGKPKKCMSVVSGKQ